MSGASQTSIAPLGFYGFLRSLYEFFEAPRELYICHEFVDGSLEDRVSAPSRDLEDKSLFALFGYLNAEQASW